VDRDVFVHPFFIFITEKEEGREEPRRFVVLRHRELTERIIGLAIEVHRHSGPGLLFNFHASRLKDGLRRFVG
jgi:hypothetical protein